MFDASLHVCTRPLSEFKAFYLAMDEGYTNPAVILLVGEDSDGRLHIIMEFYERGKLQSTVVDQARAWVLEYRVGLAAVDEAAAGLIADLQNARVPAVPSKGRVLDGINLSIDSGEIHALVGANGAGKSTLAYAIMGCEGYRPQQGTLLFESNRIDELPIQERARAGITLAWQEPARFEGLRVCDYLALGAPHGDPVEALES